MFLQVLGRHLVEYNLTKGAQLTSKNFGTVRVNKNITTLLFRYHCPSGTKGEYIYIQMKGRGAFGVNHVKAFTTKGERCDHGPGSSKISRRCDVIISWSKAT